MALKRLENGQYVIKNKKQLKEALNFFEQLKEEAQALRVEHGIVEMEEDAIELKKAATTFVISEGIDRFDFAEGKHATLVRQGYDRRIVGTKDELGEVGDPEGVVPLRTILRKKFKKAERFKEIWNQCTKRVVDVKMLEELVSNGVLDVDEIAPAYYEKQKAPYLRIFEES